MGKPARFVPYHSRGNWHGQSPYPTTLPARSCPGLRSRVRSICWRFARRNGATTLPPAGTCRMGGDDAAAVDPQPRVQDVERLWVADCSIMPTLVSGNANLPAIMIGEKASDLILAR